MEIPLQDHENVIGVQLLLFFDYQLHVSFFVNIPSLSLSSQLILCFLNNTRNPQRLIAVCFIPVDEYNIHKIV